MSQTSVEIVEYGPVELRIEPDRHVYVTSLGWFRVVMAVMFFGLEVLLGWGMSIFIAMSRGPRSFRSLSVPMLCFLGLVSLGILVMHWTVLAWRVRLELNPDGIVFTRRGLSLMGGRAGRSGTWHWRLTDLVGVGVNTLPFRDRAGWFLQSGIELNIEGEDRPVKTFFVLTSLEDAGVVRDAIVSSVVEMARRRDPNLVVETRGPSQ